MLTRPSGPSPVYTDASSPPRADGALPYGLLLEWRQVAVARPQDDERAVLEVQVGPLAPVALEREVLEP